jgi:hypothetical protein
MLVLIRYLEGILTLRQTLYGTGTVCFSSEEEETRSYVHIQGPMPTQILNFYYRTCRNPRGM